MLVALSGAALTCGSVQAVPFVNGGFEDGTFNGWTQTQGYWIGPDSIFTEPEAYAIWGDAAPSFNDCEIVNSIFPDLNAGGTLTGFEGNKAARVNDGEAGMADDGSFIGSRWSTLSQTVTDWQENNIYYSWSAVLENPYVNHGDSAPMFRVQLYDEDTDAYIYDISASASGNLPVSGGWQTASADNREWLYSGWQHASLNTSNYVGHTLTLSFTAFDCAWLQHGGYVYVDRVGSTPVPDGASTMMLLGGAVAGLGMLRRFMRK
jgi:hypothetical protein